MSTNTAQSPVTLRVTRLIKAPRERVFAAWTTPAEIVKWFGPDTCRTLSAKVDLRVGGEYHFRVKTEQFGEMDVRGIYREVKAPGRLVYTWNWKGHPQLEFGETVVTVEFVAKDGATEVQITHERFPSAEIRENHTYGWNGCLEKMERLLVASADATQTCAAAGTFCWNELLVANPGVAEKFYSQLFGWQAAEFPGGMPYTLFKKDGRDVGGLMKSPKENMPPHWLAYVFVENVDAAAKRAADLGGTVLMPPMDIPTVGRIAVFQDPQGAALGLFQPEKKG